ncbi:unnamed protein product [Symbiodinium sp. CCMP2456]|nr:unnamed protein product [Symbiodinium sp. CCMP2456]
MLQYIPPPNTLHWGPSQGRSHKPLHGLVRTRVIYDQSTLPRPHEVQTVLATPPRQLRSPAAVYATPLLPGQATPPQPQRGRLRETAPVYARQEISAASSATPPQPHPYVRTAVSAREPSNALAPLASLSEAGEVFRSDAFPLGLAAGYVDTGGTADFAAGSLCLTSEGREAVSSGDTPYKFTVRPSELQAYLKYHGTKYYGHMRVYPGYGGCSGVHKEAASFGTARLGAIHAPRLWKICAGEGFSTPGEIAAGQRASYQWSVVQRRSRISEPSHGANAAIESGIWIRQLQKRQSLPLSRHAFAALAAYSQKQQRKEQQRRLAVKCRRRILLRQAWSCFLSGAARAEQRHRQCIALEKSHADALSRRCLAAWLAFARPGCYNQACQHRPRWLQRQVLRHLRSYADLRRSKRSRAAMAAEQLRKQAARRALRRVLGRFRENHQRRAEQMHLASRCRPLAAALAANARRRALRRWQEKLKERSARRHGLAAATQLRERRLLQCTCSALLCFFQTARQQRVAVACFVAARAEEAARYWLHQWHSAVGKWRQEQVKETEAIMHWYLILAASALCHWQRWLQKRQRKKQRQAVGRKGMLDAGTTTLMLSGLPSKLNRSMLLQLLNAEGAGRYDLVHVPYDTIANRPMSVAIVNFTDYTSANKVHDFFKILQKEAGWSLHVVPAAVQGLAANLAFIVASSSIGFAAMSEPSGPLIFTDGVQVADSIAFAACCIPPTLLVEARRLIDVDARIASEFGLAECASGSASTASTASIEEPMAGRSFPHGLENSESEAWLWDVVDPGAKVLAAVLSGGNLGVSTISRRGQEVCKQNMLAEAASFCQFRHRLIFNL